MTKSAHFKEAEMSLSDGQEQHYVLAPTRPEMGNEVGSSARGSPAWEGTALSMAFPMLSSDRGHQLSPIVYFPVMSNWALFLFSVITKGLEKQFTALTAFHSLY